MDIGYQGIDRELPRGQGDAEISVARCALTDFLRRRDQRKAGRRYGGQLFF